MLCILMEFQVPVTVTLGETAKGKGQHAYWEMVLASCEWPLTETSGTSDACLCCDIRELFTLGKIREVYKLPIFTANLSLLTYILFYIFYWYSVTPYQCPYRKPQQLPAVLLIWLKDSEKNHDTLHTMKVETEKLQRSVVKKLKCHFM